VLTPYNIDQALDARDAISKALYSRLFTWLVERINLIVCRAERDKSTSLAVLDIFGFEVLLVLNLLLASVTMQTFFTNVYDFKQDISEHHVENH